jgi:tripartite-type tricarboxylate transporter receptor subunit TctC
MAVFHRLAAALAFTAAAVPAAAFAQGDYPNRPVRIVVSFTAGGTTDVIARHVAAKLTERWKQPVIVENKPGAGGTLGTDYLASQPADGYNLLMASSGPISVSPILSKKLNTNPQEALTPVILVADVANVLVTAPELKIESMKDLVAQAKAKPGQLNYASTGVGTVAHLSGAQFSDKVGIDTIHVPYKGAAAVADVIAGRVHFMFATLPSVIGQIQGGKLKPLGQVSPNRNKALPDTPTMKELGVEGMENGSWFGLFVAKGTPQPIIDKINRDVAAILREKDSIEALEKQGAVPKGGSPADFDRMIRADMEGWRPVIAKAKVTVD